MLFQVHKSVDGFASGRRWLVGESVAGTATRTNMVPAPAKCRAHPYPLPFQWARTLVFGKASDCGSTAHPCHKGMTQDSALRNETPSRRPVVAATRYVARGLRRAFRPPLKPCSDPPVRLPGTDWLPVAPAAEDRALAHDCGHTAPLRSAEHQAPAPASRREAFAPRREAAPSACSSSSRLGVTAPNCRGRARGTEWLPRDARDEWKALRRGRRWCGRL